MYTLPWVIRKVGCKWGRYRGDTTWNSAWYCLRSAAYAQHCPPPQKKNPITMFLALCCQTWQLLNLANSQALPGLTAEHSKERNNYLLEEVGSRSLWLVWVAGWREVVAADLQPNPLPGAAQAAHTLPRPRSSQTCCKETCCNRGPSGKASASWCWVSALYNQQLPWRVNSTSSSREACLWWEGGEGGLPQEGTERVTSAAAKSYPPSQDLEP